jgi:hypothetical protein
VLSLTSSRAGSAAERSFLTHYQLLGISPDERDLRVIEESALACIVRIRAYQLRREEEATLHLNQIAHALSTLLDPVRRREYDSALDQIAGRTSTRTEGPPALPSGEEEVCDVRVVYRKRTTA